MQESEEQLLKQSKVEEFKKLLVELNRKNSLFISRIPTDVKQEFTKLAFDEFEGDYGMCLKFVWLTYKGMLPPKDAQLTMMLADLNQRISALECKKEEPAEKEIRLADGRIITRRR